MAEKLPQGFRLPLFRSLTEQVLMAYAPRTFVFANGTFLALAIVSLHLYYIVPLNIIMHFTAVYLTKFDDQFFDCMKTYFHKKDYYST